MADYSTLYDRILPWLPGAEQPIVDLQIQRTARDFLRGSAIWQETLLVNTVADQQDYVLTPTEVSARPTSILWAREGGADLRVSPEGVHRRTPMTPNRPAAWFSLVPTIISFIPVPDDVYVVTVRVVLTLKAASTNAQLPDVLAFDYPDEVSAGVLANMMLMPGKPWTNTASAGLHGVQYAKAVRAIRAIAREGGRPGSSTIHGVRFGV